MTKTVSVELHFQALCSAVELDKEEKVRALLDTHPDLDLSSTNVDGLAPLDIAFMNGNRTILDLLLARGATEAIADNFASPDEASAHLQNLLAESKRQVDKFGQLIKASDSVSSAGGHSGSSEVGGTGLSATQLKECEKQRSLWMRRSHTLRRLRSGLESAGRPHAPSRVEAHVIAPQTVEMRIAQPETVATRSLFSKCKVQWSLDDTFYNVEGERIVTVNHPQAAKDSGGVVCVCRVDGLQDGRRYFLRAAFGNPKGFGPFCAAAPKSLVPSSWHLMESVERRLHRTNLNVFRRVIAEQRDDGHDHQHAHQPRPNKKRGGLRHLFSTSSSPKLQRTLHSNRVYLCVILFHEDKVLMTNEEVLPVLEIDDETPGHLHNEFLWFCKLSQAWEDVEKLKYDLSKAGEQPTLRFRSKLLHAALGMQQVLGVTDLGRPWHQPIRSLHKGQSGPVIFSCVCNLRNPKAVISLSLKWVAFSKAQRRSSLDGGHSVTAMDALRRSITEQILFHQLCSIRPAKGLYLCYLQAQSSLDSMKVVVSNASPSLLPFVKIRDNAHVTAEEWAWLRRLCRGGSASAANASSSIVVPSPTTNFLTGEGEEGSDVYEDSFLRHVKPSEIQFAFGKLVQQGITFLLDYLEIAEGARGNHRVFDHEVFEFGPDLSALLLLPPADSVCSFSETRSSSALINLQRNDLISLPLQVFEVTHLASFQPHLLKAYCRSSLALDFELLLAKQSHREAFSSEELDRAQAGLSTLLEQQQQLEDAWRSMRWLPEALTQARSKTAHCGVTFDNLALWYSSQVEGPDDSRFVVRKPLPLPQPRTSTVSAPGGYLRPHLDANENTRFEDKPVRTSVQHTKPFLSRTPTTRSDPLELNSRDAYLRFQLGEDDVVQSSAVSNLEYYRKSGSAASSTSDVVDSGHVAPENVEPYYENFPTSSRASDPALLASSHFREAKQQQQHFQNHLVEPNVLQVFAAYDTGLASGTSVRLNVTHLTTSREVIDLVIKQLNMAVIIKGKGGPIYDSDKLRNFCLAAVIGNRERCLRDDFRPLNLQNPWKRGKLFVRMKNDACAAIEQISRHSTIL